MQETQPNDKHNISAEKKNTVIKNLKFCPKAE